MGFLGQSAPGVVALVASSCFCPGFLLVAGDAQRLLVGVGVVVGSACVVDVVDFERAVGVAACGAAVPVAVEYATDVGGAVVSAITPGDGAPPA